jgi:hypothetical protein
MGIAVPGHTSELGSGGPSVLPGMVLLGIGAAAP